MHTISILGVNLQLLPQRAIYLEQLGTLLVSDVHLGKSETFQAAGIPIPSQVNHQTLERLQTLCHQFQPQQLIILGDLFHARSGLTPAVLQSWANFLQTIQIPVRLIVGNHDRPLLPRLKDLSMECCPESITVDHLIFSHDPQPQKGHLNLCGHLHPCLRLKSRLDRLRLPCFYLERSPHLLILPPFGEFTGGHEVTLKKGTAAYVVAESAVIPFEGG